MNRFLIFPEIWARTRCLLESSTRNMVPGRTEVIFPSTTIELSVGMISKYFSDGARDFQNHIAVSERRRCALPFLGRNRQIGKSPFAETACLSDDAYQRDLVKER